MINSKDEKEAPLTGHEYDGIEERDNPLPMWWLITFFATIIFAFLYYTHYEIAGSGLSLAAEFQQVEEKLESKGHASHSQQAQLPEEELSEVMGQASNIEAGKQVFLGKCAACHGQHGEGVVGPNLTDHYWIHGRGRRGDILTVIQGGVPDKGMPAWQSMISDSEIMQVAAYVYSLKETHPANGKAPQGEEIK